MEDPISRCDHTAIRMQLSLQGLVDPDKYDRNLSGMDESRLLDLRLQNRWEVDGSGIYVDCRWQAIKGNLLAITVFVTPPLYRIKRKGQQPWWNGRITRARKRQPRAFIRFKDTALPRLPAVRSAMHPKTTPNFSRGADLWVQRKQPQSPFQLCAV